LVFYEGQAQLSLTFFGCVCILCRSRLRPHLESNLQVQHLGQQPNGFVHRTLQQEHIQRQQDRNNLVQLNIAHPQTWAKLTSYKVGKFQIAGKSVKITFLSAL
jgi:hypothetical protein